MAERGMMMQRWRERKRSTYRVAKVNKNILLEAGDLNLVMAIKCGMEF